MRIQPKAITQKELKHARAVVCLNKINKQREADNLPPISTTITEEKVKSARNKILLNKLNKARDTFYKSENK